MTEHQTEALSLVVNTSKPSIQESEGLFPSSNSFNFHQDHLNQSMMETMHMMPRRKRTKVTDTRLVSKSNRLSIPSPDSNLNMQLQNCGMHFIPQTLPQTAEQKTEETFHSNRYSNAPLPTPLRFDPSLMSDILKSLAMGAPLPQLHETFSKERQAVMLPQPISSTSTPPRNLFLPNMPPLDFMGVLPPFCYDTGAPSPFSAASSAVSNHQHHHQYTMSHQQHQTLRRNRSVGNKRVTNTLPNSTTPTFRSGAMLGGRGMAMVDDGSSLSMNSSHLDLDPSEANVSLSSDAFVCR